MLNMVCNVCVKKINVIFLLFLLGSFNEVFASGSASGDIGEKLDEKFVEELKAEWNVPGLLEDYSTSNVIDSKKSQKDLDFDFHVIVVNQTDYLVSLKEVDSSKFFYTERGRFEENFSGNRFIITVYREEDDLVKEVLLEKEFTLSYPDILTESYSIHHNVVRIYIQFESLAVDVNNKQITYVALN